MMQEVTIQTTDPATGAEFHNNADDRDSYSDSDRDLDAPEYPLATASDATKAQVSTTPRPHQIEKQGVWHALAHEAVVDEGR